MKRHPFDDATVREELREQLNAAPEVEIPLAKLDLYPSFRVSSLATESVWDVVAGCLDWFRDAATQQA